MLRKILYNYEHVWLLGELLEKVTNRFLMITELLSLHIFVMDARICLVCCINYGSGGNGLGKTETSSRESVLSAKRFPSLRAAEEVDGCS